MQRTKTVNKSNVKCKAIRYFDEIDQSESIFAIIIPQNPINI